MKVDRNYIDIKDMKQKNNKSYQMRNLNKKDRDKIFNNEDEIKENKRIKQSCKDLDYEEDEKFLKNNYKRKEIKIQNTMKE